MNPALRSSLARLLPTEDESLLLRALLVGGEAGKRAWNAFAGRHDQLTDEFRTDRGRRNRLSPLLLQSLRELEVDGPPRLMTTLRTAYVREELRATIYRRILGEVLTALNGASIDVLVTRGAALSEQVYLEPCHRHSHDIDLLIRPGQQEGASAVLRGLGFKKGPPAVRGQGVSWVHSTELPILLLTRLFRYTPHEGPFEDAWERRRAVSLGGVDTHTLDPADHLAHVLGHASYCPSRSTLVWAVDAWRILATLESPDWERFRERVEAGRIAPATVVMLTYLREHLEAPVPEEIIASIDERVGPGGALGRDMALHGVRHSRSRFTVGAGHPRLSVREKLKTLWWELFPSRDYLAWAHGGRAVGPIALLYITRPITATAVKGYWALRRLPLLSRG